MMRLARYIAQAGVASRRHAEELILSGAIKVNGTTVKQVATNVDETKDSVLYRGKTLSVQQHVYYLLHKPVGVLSSRSDAHHAKLVTDLVPTEPPVYPVGRLDKDSSGLLLLTNDGDLTQLLTHPRHAIAKTYEVTVDKTVQPSLLQKLR